MRNRSNGRGVCADGEGCGGRPGCPGRKRNQLRELAIMLALGVPGLLMFAFGLKTCEGYNWNPAGLAVAAVGGILVAAAGCYYYLKDFKGTRRGALAFALITVASALAGLVGTGLLFRR
jgi:hypothetical protein